MLALYLLWVVWIKGEECADVEHKLHGVHDRRVGELARLPALGVQPAPKPGEPSQRHARSQLGKKRREERGCRGIVVHFGLGALVRLATEHSDLVGLRAVSLHHGKNTIFF